MSDLYSASAADQKILDEARERFQLAVDAEGENRTDALDDIRFAAGDQWPDEVKRARKGRPCPVNNRMQAFIKQVVNEQRRSRPAILVSPVSGKANYKTAEVMEGMIRHIERISRARVAYDTALEHAVTGGFGHFRIKTGYTSEESFDQELLIDRIDNQFTVYTDPSIHQPDGIDAGWRFVTEMVKVDDFEAKYGFTPTTIETAAKGDDAASWFEEGAARVAEYWRKLETPLTQHALSDGSTIEGKISREQMAQMQAVGVQVVQSREGVRTTVEQYLMTGDRIIKKSEWRGKYIPIITVTGSELIVDGKRKLFSLIRFAKDAARMDNFWAALESEVLALQPKAPWVAPEGSFDGHEESWLRANTENLPYLEYKPVVNGIAPQRQMFTGSPMGIREARMAAIEDQKAIMSLYDASLGARSNEVSGVAIRERDKQGNNASYHFAASMALAIESAGRMLVDLIPKVYDTARTVRIIKPDDEAEMIAINQMFLGPDGQPIQYDLAMGQYDVTVKVGPSFESQREEARAAMIDFLSSYPQAAPVVGDLVVTNMDWPEADKFAERLRNMIPPQAMGQPAPPDPMLQLAQATEQAKTQQLQMKGQMDLQLKQMDLQMKEKELQLKAMQLDEARQSHDMEMQIRAAEQQALSMRHQQQIELENMKIQAQAADQARNDQLRAYGISPHSAN